jgi:hypothetical protein
MTWPEFIKRGRARRAITTTGRERVVAEEKQVNQMKIRQENEGGK